MLVWIDVDSGASTSDLTPLDSFPQDLDNTNPTPASNIYQSQPRLTSRREISGNHSPTEN